MKTNLLPLAVICAAAVTLVACSKEAPPAPAPKADAPKKEEPKAAEAPRPMPPSAPTAAPAEGDKKK